VRSRPEDDGVDLVIEFAELIWEPLDG